MRRRRREQPAAAMMRLAATLTAVVALSLYCCCRCGVDAAHVDIPINEYCYWPLVEDWTVSWNRQVATVQYMLHVHGYYLGYAVDNEWGAATNAAVVAYQTAAGLDADGVVGSATWNAILAGSDAAQTSLGSSGEGVAALQDQLAWHGYLDDDDVTGTFDAATEQAVRAVQLETETSVTGVSSVSFFKLLLTGCYMSPTNHFGIDLSYYEGNLTKETMQCLRDNGAEYIIFQAQTSDGQVNPYIVNDIYWARRMSFTSIGIYLFPDWSDDATTQVTATLQYLKDRNIEYDRVWLDVEGSPSITADYAVQWLLDALDVVYAFGHPAGMYTAYWNGWGITDYVVMPEFYELPLWYAHYDAQPSFTDFAGPFGGWEEPTIKQFLGDDTKVDCDVWLDWNWAATEFWASDVGASSGDTDSSSEAAAEPDDGGTGDVDSIDTATLLLGVVAALALAATAGVAAALLLRRRKTRGDMRGALDGATIDAYARPAVSSADTHHLVNGGAYAGNPQVERVHAEHTAMGAGGRGSRRRSVPRQNA